MINLEFREMALKYYIKQRMVCINVTKEHERTDRPPASTQRELLQNR